MSFFYFMGYLFSSIPVRAFNRWRVFHREYLPKTGGFILASNHASHLDPMALGVAIYPRELHYMARSTLFRPRWWGWLLEKVNTHPIIRGQGPDQDWDSFLEVVRGGNALLVFPEGTRTEDGELQRGKSGFGRLAHMARMPVYPAYIEGSYNIWPKGGKYKTGSLRIWFGQPVGLDDLFAQSGEKRVIREISSRVMQAIAALKAEAEQYSLAGKV